MKKFLLFFLLLIPVPVFATYMQPTLMCATDSVNNDCGSSSYTIYGGFDWYSYKTPTYQRTTGLIKSTIVYDLSNFNDSYVNIIFFTKENVNNIVATMDNDLCEVKNGFTGLSSGSYNTSSSFGLVCPVANKSEVYLNIQITKSAAPGDFYHEIFVSANNKSFNDKNTAIIQSSIDAQTAQQNAQNQIINNTNTGNNSSDFSNVVNNNTLPNNSHAFDILGGLQGLINGLQPSGACSRISVPVPFTNQTLVLPCMTTDVYSVHFPEIVVIWQLIVRGIVYYYILVNILRLVKETIDPFNFKLEVMDL